MHSAQFGEHDVVQSNPILKLPYLQMHYLVLPSRLKKAERHDLQSYCDGPEQVRHESSHLMQADRLALK